MNEQLSDKRPPVDAGSGRSRIDLSQVIAFGLLGLLVVYFIASDLGLVS